MRRTSPYSPALPWPASGTIVSVPFLIVFRHLGIISDRRHQGKPMVISNSPWSGGVSEQPWGMFTGGFDVALAGYPSNLPPYEVLRRARSQIGTRYSLLTWNCDHFVRYAHGLASESPQLARAVLLLAVGTTLVLAGRR